MRVSGLRLGFRVNPLSLLSFHLSVWHLHTSHYLLLNLGFAIAAAAAVDAVSTSPLCVAGSCLCWSS